MSDIDHDRDHQSDTRPDEHRTRTRVLLAVAAVAAVALIALLAVVFNGGGANARDCEKAIRAMAPSATAGVDHSDDKPEACEGLSDEQLERIGESVMGEMFQEFADKR